MSESDLPVLECDCIRPTRTCFDDALEYLSDAGKKVFMETGSHEATQAALDELRLVHGICRAPDGHRYAHAWVEKANEVWQAGIVSGGEHDGKRIEYWCERSSFYETVGVIETTVYTAVGACLENVRTGHFGPWEPRYQELCGKNDERSWVGAKTTGSGTLSNCGKESRVQEHPDEEEHRRCNAEGDP